MDDEFNIDDYLENPEFERKMEAYKERMIAQAIEHNYENMSKNGISDWHVRHMNKDEMTQLKETLEFMLKYYIDEEQYERCILLKSELEKVDKILDRVS